ncbi:Zinc finger C2H2 superfamily [Sergentomyia squamirostris]
MEFEENSIYRCNFIKKLCEKINEIHNEVIEHEDSRPKCEICTEKKNDFKSIKDQLFILVQINIRLKEENPKYIINTTQLENTQYGVVKEETDIIETNFVAVEETSLKPSTSFTCDLCNTLFKKKSQLVKHLKTHMKNGKRKIKLTEKKCPFCHKIYKLKHKCKIIEPRRKFSCEFCPEVFTTFAKIHCHHKSHHPEKPKPLSPYQCEVCGRFSVYLSALRHHMKTHTGVLLYNCNVCQKRFRTRHQLIEHERKHIPKDERDDKYKCDICDKKFTFRQSWVKHKAHQHNGTRKNFSCSVCGWKFISDKSLKKHSSTHDGDKSLPFKCDDCGRIFEKLKYLNQHRKIQHKILTDLMLNRKTNKKIQ